MASNADTEMQWVKAWSDLYDIVEGRKDTQCRLPDGSLVDLECCKGWLQESVYQGYHVDVTRGWDRGRQVVVVLRSLPDDQV